ncbi:ABC transporter permease [Kallotenue papyrolyticum]|uniref:ABC transporter permease n=1 Tax=Kallotenue papyrolyticum TaxID=1325125 RepID=UPI0004785CD8|nr:ABC-2 family transporter protein [Kallotenue papyrolyticum]
MRLYYEIAVRSFRRITTYRVSFVLGIITNAFFGALRCFVFIALYRQQAAPVVAGFTLSDAITYTWLTQSLISIGAGWIASDVAMTIRSGDVITDLSRPWSFTGAWLSRFLGERVFNLCVRGTLTYAIGVLLFGARLPTPGALAGFGAAIGLALLLSFAYMFLVNLTAFWLLDNTGVVLIANILLSFFSGFYLPLAFFPAALQAVAAALPFQAITSLPARIFLGQIQGPELGAALLLQSAWVVVLFGLNRLMLRLAVRTIVIQGG